MIGQAAAAASYFTLRLYGLAAAARNFHDWNNYVPHASSTLIFKSFVAVPERGSGIGHTDDSRTI